MKNQRKNLLMCGLLGGLIFTQACTNLDETVYNQIPQSAYGVNADQLATLIGPLYGGLGDYYGNFAGLNATSDEQVVPTRGGDWKDGDQWKRFETHAWSATLDDGTFNGIWNWAYTNVAKINQQLANPSITDAQTIAELKTIRAFYHYIVLDNFGNGIIADGNAPSGSEASALPVQVTRKQLYDYVVAELEAAIPTLSAVAGGSNYGRMTKYAAEMILAKTFLNAEVYTGTAQWQKAQDLTTDIINSGKFAMAADFFSNFTINNEGSPEIILATPMDKTKRTGFNTQFSTLHYKHQLTYDLGAAPWNGYCTAVEFYNSFADDDTRKKMWIVGQQYDIAGVPLKDDDLDMIIDPVIPAFEMAAGAAGRLKGARSQKYQIQLHNKTAGNSQDNDFVVYRLADVYLMRGETKFRLGDKAGAAEDFNVIRSLRNVPDFDASLTAADMLAERGRELAWEFHRRQDLIRFGVWGNAWTFKPASDANHQLYPIPQSQISLNPNLKQNSGY
ncbi:MAG: RagB/SusD family nutrient uptake outer membrane protein [Chryseolinea sp.]